MKKFKGYKIELDPNNVQKTLFRKHCGAARWAYNFALEKKKAAFDKKEKIPSNIDLHKELNKLKGTEVLPWAYEVSKCSFQEGLRHCDVAFSEFFRKCKLKIKGKKGFPKFKSKKNEKQSFYTGEGDRTKLLANGYVQLSRIGKVKLKEKNYIPLDIKIKFATVSYKAGKWFIAIKTEEEIQELPKSNKIIGVDLGIKTLATCSDGTNYANPKALKNNLRKLKRKQRQFSKKKKGSNNRKKAQLKLSKLHYKISNIRKDALHKATSKIINDNQVIVIENLKLTNMLKNHNLAQAISDMSAYEFHRQLEYKAKWYGREVIVSDTFYPSSKLCSCCGWKNEELKLSDRVFKCLICGNEMDRDLNGAKNLAKLYTVGSTGIQASGDGSSLYQAIGEVSPSLKEESNEKFTYTLKGDMGFCKF